MTALHSLHSFTLSTVGNIMTIGFTNISSGAVYSLSQVAASSDVAFCEKQMRDHLNSLTDDQISEFFPKERTVMEKVRKDKVEVEAVDPVKAIRKAKKDVQSGELPWSDRVAALAYVYQNTDFSKDAKGFIFKDFGKLVNALGKDAIKEISKREENS